MNKFEIDYLLDIDFFPGFITKNFFYIVSSYL
jgi:hypothetical protein